LFIIIRINFISAVIDYGLKNFRYNDYIPTYIVLFIRDNSRELWYKKDLFLYYLKINYNNRRFDKRIKKVILKEFNITLNIEDAYFNYKNIRIDLK